MVRLLKVLIVIAIGPGQLIFRKKGGGNLGSFCFLLIFSLKSRALDHPAKAPLLRRYAVVHVRHMSRDLIKEFKDMTENPHSAESRHSC